MGVISIVNGDYEPTYNWGGYHLVEKKQQTQVVISPTAECPMTTRRGH